ncbi:MAG: hypothetical protein JF588_18350 [Caulobacterales bacterium]|nr:hypothetical protein [Caulobacterales bacterium]
MSGVARLTRGLCLAASPTFALMALLSAGPDAGPMAAMCSAGSPLGGMVPMYLLMSVFHAGPWLRLAAGRAGTRALSPSGRPLN